MRHFTAFTINYFKILVGQAQTGPPPKNSSGFIDKMLIKDPSQRATAAELLHHPFLKTAGSSSVLLPLIQQIENSSQSNDN